MLKQQNMKMLFPDLGESILLEIIKARPDIMRDKLNLCTCPSTGLSVYPQVPISFNPSPPSFDGCHKLDLGLLYKNEIIPIEVKLGDTRLTPAAMRDRLADCTKSKHKTSRINGSMLAILDRRYDNDLKKDTANSTLQAKCNKQWYNVSEKWAIIAKEHIINGWKNNEGSIFQSNPTYIAIEDICREFGKTKFDELVKDLLLNIPSYYKAWINPARSTKNNI